MSNGFQYSERTIARNKQYTSRKPLISALIWHPKSGRGIFRTMTRLLAVKSIFCWFFMAARTNFWLLDFHEISRSQFWRCNHFQGVKLKLRSSAFCWGIVCLNACIGSIQILNSNVLQIHFLLDKVCSMILSVVFSIFSPTICFKRFLTIIWFS